MKELWAAIGVGVANSRAFRGRQVMQIEEAGQV